MLEKQLARKYKILIEKSLPGVWYYKIKDDPAGGGGRRPFDAILVYRNLAFAIEYKVNKRQLTEYQKYQKEIFPGPYFIITEDIDPDWFIAQVKNIAQQIKGEEVI